MGSGNAACVGWTWTYGKCYIKSSVGCMTYDPAATSGYCRPWSGPPQCGHGANMLMQASADRNDSTAALGDELGSQTCSTQGNACTPSVDGKPPISCCGELECQQIFGGKGCECPATCAAPGETCYDSVDGKPPLTCCDGYECQQIIGGKRCASNREETTTALPPSEDAHTTASDASTSCE